MHKGEEAMSLRNIWNRSRVSNNSVDDPPKGMDRLQILALTKAVSISKTVTDVTLGPNSKQNAYSECKDDGTTEAETLQSHSERKDSRAESTRNISSETVALGVDDISRTIMKLKAEMDHQRKMEVREIVKSHVRKMEETTKKQREILKLKSENIQREYKAGLWQEGQEILRQIHEDELQTSQRQLQLVQKHKQHAQRINARNQMIKEAEERRKELEEEEKKKMKEKEAEKIRKELEEEKKIKEKREHLEKMIQYKKDLNSIFKEIASALKKCENKDQLVSKVSSETSKLRNLYEAVEDLMNQCKVGDVDLQEAATIVQQAIAIKEYVCAEIANAIEENGKTIEETAGKLQQKPVKQPAAVPTSSHVEDLNDFVDGDSYKMYTSLQAYLKNFDSCYEALVKDEKMKKLKFSCQKAVNIPVNAIAPTSAAHIQDKYKKLSMLISGQVVNTENGSFSAASHPQAVAYCKTLLAKKFVYQGEMTVSSKPEAAFAIAAVIVALWTDFPDFGQLLLAHFHKECPYLVPVFMPQVEGQSNSDYYKTLGYHFSENGEVESHDKFLKRMSGIMRLYAAILVTHPRRQQSEPNPHGLAHAWRWLSCLLNLEPMPDICAALLYDFLDVTGSAMYSKYGQQFQKLLHLIAKDYFPKISMKTVSSGPLVRLEVFLQKILKHQGHIPPPTGILPPNFW